MIATKWVTSSMNGEGDSAGEAEAGISAVNCTPAVRG